MSRLKGVCVGAGYFSQFHFEAWQRIPEVEIAAVCDEDNTCARQASETFDMPGIYTDFLEMLDAEQPDFVDIITPPATHEKLCYDAGKRGIHIICQKPLAPSLSEAEKLVHQADEHEVRLMVHENFRFQPWHREIKKLLDAGAIGDTLHTLTFRSRMGDGWGEDAYLGRQPYFREMSKLLIYETGVHFIDTFRYLAGDVTQVYARLRRLNPVISGEDCGMMMLTFENGAVGLWDANRFNESASKDFRYTFGTFLVEGSAGSIRLYEDGSITVQRLGKQEVEHKYHHVNKGFGGDCCYNTQRHFADCMIKQTPFETSGQDYLNVLRIQDAVYNSAEANRPIFI